MSFNSFSKVFQPIFLGILSIGSSINSKIKHYKTSYFNNFVFLIKTQVQELFIKLYYSVKKHLYTINHKRIALNYFYFALWMGLSGAFLALLIRLELSHPGSSFFKGNALVYLQVITSHGLIMVFFVVVPIIFGFFGNFLLPLHIGSKDVAYPRLNSIGFWILPAGFILICKAAFIRHKMWKPKESNDTVYLDSFNVNKDFWFTNNNTVKSKYTGKDNKDKEDLSLENDSFSLNELRVSKFFRNLRWETREFVENLWTYTLRPGIKTKRHKVFIEKSLDSHTTCTGWTFITPFTSSVEKSAVGPVDCLVFSVIAAGVSTTIGFTNLLVTRRTLTMPGLNNRRFLIPFLTIAVLLALRFLALITPVLGGCMIMIFTDRHWGTAFFDFAYGGDPILSQHLFWFFGHPEVYVLIIPTFGIINMVLPYSAFRRVASKQHMIWAIYVMGYMGFLVWGHHMYLVGLDHRARTLYSTITVMISLPATIKIFSWTLSVLNSPIRLTPVTFSTLIYILFFLVSGLTGMWLSHVTLNINMHDTYYVIAHFHLMLSATAVLGLIIGVYYYFTTFFGVKLSRTFIWLHLINFTLGHLLTFIPQFFIGVAGMPRRINDYPDIFAGWHGLSTAGYFVTLLGLLGFFLVIIDSHIKHKFYKHYILTPRVNHRGTYFTLRFSQLNSVDNKKKFNSNHK